MTPDEWTAQTEGTLEAVVLACTSMIATHPEREKVSALLQALVAKAADGPQDSPETRSYKLGIRRAVSMIEAGVKTALDATEIARLKSSSGTH